MNRFSFLIAIIVLSIAIYLTRASDNYFIMGLSALLIIANTTALKKVRQKNDLVNVIIIMGNALLCIFLGIKFIEEGKIYIQYIYLIAAFIFLIAMYNIYRRNLKPFKKFSSK
jgi:hypothetical protein